MTLSEYKAHYGMTEDMYQQIVQMLEEMGLSEEVLGPHIQQPSVEVN